MTPSFRRIKFAHYLPTKHVLMFVFTLMMLLLLTITSNLSSSMALFKYFDIQMRCKLAIRMFQVREDLQSRFSRKQSSLATRITTLSTGPYRQSSSKEKSVSTMWKPTTNKFWGEEDKFGNWLGHSILYKIFCTVLYILVRSYIVFFLLWTDKRLYSFS